AVYRMRLLSRMNNVKANSGVWMKSARPRKPSISQGLHPHPRQAISLASMDQNGPPKPDNPIAKHREIVDISWYHVVVEVAVHDRPEPLASPRDRFMHAPA
ncbi:MAG TPA: hypothetical protein VIY49_13555, partial [Bryobacteraceae bacterium]